MKAYIHMRTEFERLHIGCICRPRSKKMLTVRIDGIIKDKIKPTRAKDLLFNSHMKTNHITKQRLDMAIRI